MDYDEKHFIIGFKAFLTAFRGLGIENFIQLKVFAVVNGGSLLLLHGVKLGNASALVPPTYFYSTKCTAMLQDYGFKVNEESLQQLVQAEQWPEAFDLLVGPIHEWLYEEQHFDAIHSRTSTEQLILSFDYVQMQVAQGGFIQLIQNGYTPLLVMIIESLQKLNLAPEMVTVLDDVLKVFVLNKDVLDRETSVEEFGRLYHEFKEFEVLEERYLESLPHTIKEIVLHISGQTAER